MSNRDLPSYSPSVALRKYRQEIEENPQLTDVEIRILFQKIAHKASPTVKNEYKQKIALSYLGFVVEVAESFTEIEHVLVDYIQEGNIALLLAIDTYPVLGQQDFLAYCTPLLYKQITLYIKENPLPPEHQSTLIPIKQ